MKKLNLINLEAFRKENHITQEEIASFLGTTRGYISLVESGRSRLADEKIDKLINEGQHMKGWNIYPLNPLYSNLCTLSKYLLTRDKSIRPSFNLETGQNPLMIIPIEMLTIKHGKQNITGQIVETITTRFPFVNRDWLLSGNGEMILTEEQILQKDKIEQKVTINMLFDKIEEMNNRLKRIEDLLNRK